MPSSITAKLERTERFEICTRSVMLEVPADEVFAFCTTRAGFIAHYPNPIRRYRGAEQWVLGSEFWLDYRYFGLPMTWHGKVTEFESNQYFKDEMISGMFRYWEHTHSVEALGSATKYTDSVRFSLGLGRLIDHYFVKPSLDTFFERRHDLLRAALTSQRRVNTPRE
jgi:ligand-binding SRPBCC domain-containing protein